MATFTITITLPQTECEFGRWLDDHGAEVSISCMLGIYHVSIGWKQLLSYSAEDGERASVWRVSRHNKELGVALDEALRAAIRIAEDHREQLRTLLDPEAG